MSKGPSSGAISDFERVNTSTVDDMRHSGDSRARQVLYG